MVYHNHILAFIVSSPTIVKNGIFYFGLWSNQSTIAKMVPIDIFLKIGLRKLIFVMYDTNVHVLEMRRKSCIKNDMTNQYMFT